MAFLDVWVKPGAKKERVYIDAAGRLVFQITARPQKNKANEACIRLLSRLTGLPRRRIRLVSGQTARQKRFELESWTASDVEKWKQGVASGKD